MNKYRGDDTWNVPNAPNAAVKNCDVRTAVLGKYPIEYIHALNAVRLAKRSLTTGTERFCALISLVLSTEKFNTHDHESGDLRQSN